MPVGGSGLSGPFMSGWNRLLEGLVLCWARIKSMWKRLKIDVYSSWKRCGSSRLVGLSPGLPGEVLLQRHHLLSAPLRRCPLLSLHTQMLFDLRLQIIALLDQCRRCRCRQTRQQFTLNPTDYNPSEGLRRHRASVQNFNLPNWTGNRSSTSCELILII